jgi:predicted ribosomally synthesized peptide with SipW-like signal peptide
LVLTFLVLTVFAGVVGVGALAVFTDQQAISSNSFTTGTVSLGLSPTTTLITFSGMLPGDTVTNPLVVSNNAGSAALRYAISSTATNTDSKALKDQLVLTIKTVDVTTPLVPCDNFDGTQLYSGDLDSTAGKLVGDPTQGNQTGDRPLAVGGSETLCFRANLPLSTGNAFKAATTTATFTFDAEQTANNP